MSDIIDDAQTMESQERSARINAIRAALYTLSGQGPLWINGNPHCSICEGQISQARIEALPNTSWCIICAEEQEQML